MVSPGKTVSILAPFEVRPGHIMLAPLRMNLMAPLSTCSHGNMNGSAKDATRRKDEERKKWMGRVEGG